MFVNGRGDLAFGSMLVLPGGIAVYLLCVMAYFLVTFLIRRRSPDARFFGVAAVRRANLVLGFGPFIIATVISLALAVAGRMEGAILSLGFAFLAYPQTWVGLLVGLIALGASPRARTVQGVSFGLIAASAIASAIMRRSLG